MALAALLPLLPLTNARHLHDQLSLAYEDVSSSSSSSSSSGSSDSSLPAWHANPFHGLEQSSYDSSDDSSGDVSSREYVESESSYEEIAQAAVNAAMRELRRQRIRHRRSHEFRFFVRSQHEAAEAAPEWENPCGGVYQPDAGQTAESDSSSHGRVIKRKYLIALRNNTMREYDYMHNSATLDYGKTEHWEHEYKFLPNMTRPTNAVKLKTWYRHMQTFVGSFAHLGKAHYRYRKEHQLSLDASTHELHDLLVSARSVLCDIETTINSSYPNSHGAKLTQVSKEAMSERLKFYTPADGSKESNLRDLKFSKQLYLQYLDNMWKTLRRSLRKQHRSSMERKHHASSATSVSGSNSNSNSAQNFSLESSESGSMAAAAAAVAATG
ncbi:uncharacterized protein LOC117788085 [Drosophila innubila]|uniref:uncharacterized protein LOC117788085 n=1 Tax=Drosophila innubila TaxID=198719 RepID=UPI00148DE163|nr:uncharacterized protein LOC117788085 [Drosophila innubila]